MFRFSKILTIFSLCLVPCIAQAGQPSCQDKCRFKQEDIAGSFVASSHSFGTDCCGKDDWSQTTISQSTVDKDGYGTINFLSLTSLNKSAKIEPQTVAFPPNGNGFTISTNSIPPLTGIETRSVLLNKELGTGYFVILDYPNEGDYLTYDTVYYSTSPHERITNSILNPTAIDPVDPNFAEIVDGRTRAECGGSFFPTTNGLTHAIKQCTFK